MRLFVPLACAVRCSVTGNLLTDSALTARNEKRQLKIAHKKDGYAVFTDLEPGEHLITFSYPGYREGKLKVELPPGKTELEVVNLRPLRIPTEDVWRLKVTGLEPGSFVYMAVQQFPLRLAGDFPAGTEEMTLFRRASAALLLPTRLLCADPEAPELCILRDRLSADLWASAKPMSKAHKRGTLFYPVQDYRADENGCLEAVFFQPGKVSLYDGRKLYEIQLEERKTQWQIPL